MRRPRVEGLRVEGGVLGVPHHHDVVRLGVLGGHEVGLVVPVDLAPLADGPLVHPGVPAHLQPGVGVQEPSLPTLEFRDETLDFSNETLELSEETVKFSDETLEFRDETLEFGDELLNFMDETMDLRDKNT